MMNSRKLSLVATSALILLAASACTSTPRPRNPASTAAANAAELKAIRAEFAKAADSKLTFLKPRLSAVIKWLRKSPISAFEVLRQDSPIITLEAIPIKGEAHENIATVVVSQYDDVVNILNQPKVFSVRNYVMKMTESVGPFMLAQDEIPMFTTEKQWMREMIGPKDIPALRATVRALATKAVEDGAFYAAGPDGRPSVRLEVVNQVARRVPIQLTGEYFGFPGPSLETMYRWSHATQDDFFHNIKNEADVHARAVSAGKAMHRYLKTLVKERRAEIAAGTAKDDVLTRMLKSGYASDLTDGRIESNIIGTLVGGVETTQAAVVQGLNQLLRHPDHLKGALAALSADDDALFARYVWEALRFDPVNPFVIRYAERDAVVSGVTIKRGSIVLVGTQSAMFDPAHVTDPSRFSVDPRERPSDTYFHLGYGHHRCLGDYVSEVQVPEILRALLLKPGIRTAYGYDGVINKSHLPSFLFKAPEDRRAFPERFVVEFDFDGQYASSGPKVIEPQYAFEEYLQDFDRKEFRECLAGSDGPSGKFERIQFNLRRNKEVSPAVDLFYCRLNRAFRRCLGPSPDMPKLATPANLKKVVACAEKSGGTATEVAFYQNVVFKQWLDLSKVSTRQSESPKTYDFEKVLRYYDRVTFRDCFMNPKAPSSFPNEKDMIFYARLNLTFRTCMGIPVILHGMTGGRFGEDRPTQFQKCKNGVPNETTGMTEGALTLEEQYYYRTMILGEKSLSFDELLRQETASR